MLLSVRFNEIKLAFDADLLNSWGFFAMLDQIVVWSLVWLFDLVLFVQHLSVVVQVRLGPNYIDAIGDGLGVVLLMMPACVDE